MPAFAPGWESSAEIPPAGRNVFRRARGVGAADGCPGRCEPAEQSMFVRNQAQQHWLEALIAQLGGTAGTVHVRRGDDLYLTAAHNIPANVVAIVAHVPHGKGMAGAAQVKKQPVQTCDLQTDATGTVRPGAKAVDAQAAVALPVFDANGGVSAVVGIAWSGAGDIARGEEQAMLQLAAGLPP
jgi:L-methionine (R)-S-oxide reductase